MNIKPIVGTAIGLGATSLVLQSTKMLPKIIRSKRKSYKLRLPSSKDMLKTGTGILVGGTILGAAAAIK